MKEVKLKKEEALVLLLGRLHFDTFTKTRIFHIIKNGVDWYEFLNISVKTKTICLVYKSLIHLGLIQLLPAIVKNNMQYHYEQNCNQNTYFFQAITSISAFFEQNNILSTCVKGMRFLNTIYSKDPGVRILSDIDFLALDKDKISVHTYMQQLGFYTYLINDNDVFCEDNNPVKSYFYIKYEDEKIFDKLRIDFDFTYSHEFINAIKTSDNPLYEFMYLCENYYTCMKKKSMPSSIQQYDYMKLVDLHEYYIKYLSHIDIRELNNLATQLNFNAALQYTFQCLEKLYTDI